MSSKKGRMSKATIINIVFAAIAIGSIVTAILVVDEPWVRRYKLTVVNPVHWEGADDGYVEVAPGDTVKDGSFITITLVLGHPLNFGGWQGPDAGEVAEAVAAQTYYIRMNSDKQIEPIWQV